MRAISNLNAFVFAASRYGLEVAAGDTDWEGRDEVACAAGPAAVNDSRVAVYDYFGLSGLVEKPGSRFEAFAGGLGGGRVAFGSWWDEDLHRELPVSRGPLGANAAEVAVFDDAAKTFVGF